MVMVSMNPFSRDAVADYTIEMLITLRDNELQARNDHFETIDDYYYNRVAGDIVNGVSRDGSAAKYFPQLPGETDEEFDKRIKIGVPFARFFVDKIIYYMSKGEAEYSWEPRTESEEVDEATEALQEQADKFTAKLMEYNDFHNKRREYMRNVLKYGYTLTKPKYIKFNDVGQEIKYDDIQLSGTVEWMERLHIT